MRYLGIASIFAVLLVIGSACGSASPSRGSTGAGSTTSLRVGLLPILDVLPMYVADAEGFFKEQKVDVEFVLFASALERDSAFQTGQIDAELNDLVSTALLNKDAERAKVVRLAFKPTSKLAMLSIFAAPTSSRIGSAIDLKGIQIAVSGNTVIEYTTDKLLRSAGLAPSDIKTTEVTKIPVRVEMLLKGQIEAATLPEPFASLAAQQGAKLVVDDRKDKVSQSVVTFQQEVISKNPEGVRRFLAAYEKGVEAIAEKPDAYRALLIEKAKVPEALQATFVRPEYPRAGVSSREDVESVVEWMVGKGLLSKKLSYEQMVNDQLLPK